MAQYEKLLEFLFIFSIRVKKKMDECQLKWEHCEKILADELNKDINGVPLNQLKVDEQVSKVKIYTFFYEDQKPFLEFMLNHREELFTNDYGLLDTLNEFQDYLIISEWKPWSFFMFVNHDTEQYKSEFFLSIWFYW